MSYYWLIPFCIISYFIGNINFAVIISRARKKDIYKMASGNPGTMNMIRQFGFKIGALTLLLDVLKGVIPAFAGACIFGGLGYEILGGYCGLTEGLIALFACGLSACLGHCFPVLLKFKGGKGVATTIGVFLVANPMISIMAFTVMLLFLAFFEYGAMGSFMFITFMVIFVTLQDNTDIVVALLLFVFYFLSWYTHRKNIARLLVGKENSMSYLKGLHLRRRKKRHEKWLDSLRGEEKTEEQS